MFVISFPTTLKIKDEDQGYIRLKHTTDGGKIEENLNVLINRWAYIKDGPVTQETLHAMENLRVHIGKGCLSDTPPGCGTERNEYIHRILNQSLLVGSTSISVELAFTILTIIFFDMNTKKRYKDVFGDAHLQLGVPVEWVTASKKLGTHCEENIEPIKRGQGRSECVQSSSSLECGANNVVSQSGGGLLLVCDNAEDSDILRRNIEAFRCPGFFKNEVGDFVMKAASSILRIPIVIVSSNETAYCIPFVPPHPVMKILLYVAFTSYGPGHYDSTGLLWSVTGTFSK